MLKCKLGTLKSWVLAKQPDAPTTTQLKVSSLGTPLASLTVNTRPPSDTHFGCPFAVLKPRALTYTRVETIMGKQQSMSMGQRPIVRDLTSYARKQSNMYLS